MEINNLTRNELLAKVYMRVLKEDQRMDTHKYFYYDDDLSKFISFSTKEQLIDRIGEEAIIDIVGELCFN